MKEYLHTADFCVVGGGIAGLIAAVSAARRGAKVTLVQDRPVLGGNASSEIRMWLSGAHGKNNRETGIVEELLLENDYRNPSLVFSIWDEILYGLAKGEPNLELLLNTTVHDLEKSVDGVSIAAVKAWQLTSQQHHVIRARLFADCSGDSVLAPLSGAHFRMGREAASEFGEDIEPEKADAHTMGNSCLMQWRETTSPKPYIPPKWARKFHGPEEFQHRFNGNIRGYENLWWLELGGMEDTINDAEAIRDRLLPLAFGVWDYIKNVSPTRDQAANWELDWVGFLPGKRESRRYVGAHVLTQNDVRAGGPFDDTVAFGGWTMDDHNPHGFDTTEPPNTFHPAPSPFGISYKCLYSNNICNLFFAGRNISTTHAALSASRVMRTCALLGQAVGTAAALCVKYGCLPADISAAHVPELQQALMEDDCFLPGGFRRTIPALTAEAALVASDDSDASALVDGIDRPVGDVDHGWTAPIGTTLTIKFARPSSVRRLRAVFDSDLNRKGTGDCAEGDEMNSLSNYPLNAQPRTPPAPLMRAFTVEGLRADGAVVTLAQVEDNWQRLWRMELPDNGEFAAVRLIPRATWGNAATQHLFAFQAE